MENSSLPQSLKSIRGKFKEGRRHVGAFNLPFSIHDIEHVHLVHMTWSKYPEGFNTHDMEQVSRRL
jgi:hypothetical protein